MKYVTEGARYACPYGTQFSSFIIGARSSGGGKSLLTERTKLRVTLQAPSCPKIPGSPPPPCPLVTGSVVPCHWSSTDKNTAGGAKLLTEDSTAKCPSGATLRRTSNPNTRVQDGAASAAASAIAFPALAAAASTASHASTGKGAAADVRKSSEKQTDKQENAAVTSKQGNDGKAAAAQPRQRGPLCPGCDRAEPCAYAHAATTLAIPNDSQKLWAAYRKKPAADKDDHDRYCDRRMEEWRLYEEMLAKRWSYAAHHIISGNQIFAAVPELVQLANAYGFDINNARNCIILVTRADRLGDDDIKKSATAYETMSETRMQWHVGGHSYKFEHEDTSRIRARIEQLTGEPLQGEIANYADIVRGELERWVAAMEEHPVCRDTAAQKAAFVRKMNRIAAQVKAKLAAFQGRPDASYPLYVSREALYYAFDLPRKVRLAVLRGTEQRVTLDNCRATRFRATEASDERTLAFQFSADAGRHAEAALPLADADIRRMITCAGNARAFVVINTVPQQLLAALGANEGNTYRLEAWEFFGPETTEAVLHQNDSEILSWLRRQPERPYESPAMLVRDRLRAWEAAQQKGDEDA